MLCSPALSLGVPIYRDLRQAPMIQSVSPPHPHRHASNRGGAVSAAARSAFMYSAVVPARGSVAPCNLRKAGSPPARDSRRAGRLRPSWDWRAAEWCFCSKQLAEQFLGPSPLLLDRNEHADARPGVPCRNHMAHRAPGCAEQMTEEGQPSPSIEPQSSGGSAPFRAFVQPTERRSGADSGRSWDRSSRRDGL
jgi:hypothetical protein